ncbi:hypothetical protein SGCZBJ_18170 [Caulobacter zeae]|uniref:Uncharacterized protein n=1 Tax=Caulobacter zeae TaxID=2055137 RepID=A0A2N5D8H4_9CAUL|nr:hypothetical protein [Caulobacter zeae]PLR22363.1 hypothetical protein SGCZBJ_18170 [Caulobacter zeae]
MNDKLKTVQDDLAFLRGLAEGGTERAGLGVAGGGLYGSAGLLYGIQCLIYVAQENGLVSLGGLGNLILAWLPTVIFLILMTIVIVVERRRPKGGVTHRAINAAFAGAGLANLALIIVFAVAAVKNQDFRYWLYHPAVVFVLQGAVWYAVFALRKRAWMLAVSLGWLATGVAMGLLVDRAGLYLLIACFGLFAFMAAPGFFMMRQAMDRPAGLGA